MPTTQKQYSKLCYVFCIILFSLEKPLNISHVSYVMAQRAGEREC